MDAKITISASDVWDYFQDTKEDLKSHMHYIASNPDYGVEIFITEDSGLPSIVVTADDALVYEKTAANAHDCQSTVAKIYDDYLTSKVFSLISDNNEADLLETDLDEMIAAREEELDDAVYEFLITVSGEVYYNAHYAEVVDDLKEHFLEYMARKHGIPVYRPMVLEYDDGTEELSEYPYDDMEFDDIDNPLYT